MPKIDLSAVSVEYETGYPPQFERLVGRREMQSLSEVGGLTQFGARLTTLQPGAMSALRHWHEVQDEFALVLDGELVLVEDAGETVMKAGDCAAFSAGRADGHHFINRSDRPVRLLAVGTTTDDERVHYPDDDIHVVMKDRVDTCLHKDGTPYNGDET